MAHYGAKGRNSESASGFKPAMEHANSDILTLVSYDFQKKTSINPLTSSSIKPTFSLTHLSLSTASITKVKEKHKKKVKEKNTKK